MLKSFFLDKQNGFYAWAMLTLLLGLSWYTVQLLVFYNAWNREIYIQERRSTPMNLDLLHDLFDIIEEGFALDAPDRDIKREAKDTLADVEGIVPTEAKYVERPAPVSPPGSRMRFR